MNRTALLHVPCLLVAALGALACSAKTEEGTPPAGSGGVIGFGGAGGTSAGGLGQTGGTTPIGSGGVIDIPTGSGGSGTGGNPDECAGVAQKAEKAQGKADIIWIIDTSPSMITELAAVGQNMNAFSQFITGTGIDVHVVAIAAGLCIQPPLGSGDCANDAKPPVYTHIPYPVGSWDALQDLQALYPQYESALRPDATKTIVVVTDDEALLGPPAADFKKFFDDKWTGQTWRFSGIFCAGGFSLNCSGNGVTYDTLVKQTGGVWVDMGNPNPDWTAVFKELGDAVVKDAKPVDCEWVIPPAPQGQSFDENKVNVEFTPSSGTKETLLKRKGADTCDATSGGWFYGYGADPSVPVKVTACPASCTRMQADDGAAVNLSFGCASKTEIE